MGGVSCADRAPAEGRRILRQQQQRQRSIGAGVRFIALWMDTVEHTESSTYLVVFLFFVCVRCAVPS